MKMNDDDLLRLLQEHEDEAEKTSDHESEQAQDKAVAAYMRLPYGNESEGRSSVVTSDVFDAVEGMTPELVEIFTASDDAVLFEAQGPEDEEGAQQASDACNYVFYRQNNGFLILYTAIKDALLSRVGAVKWCWEEKRTPIFETFAGDEVQIAAHLMANPDAEVVGQDEIDPTDEEQQQYQAVAQQWQMAGMEPPAMPVKYRVKLRTVKKTGRVRVDAMPPDELRVSGRHNSILLDDCAYVAHVQVKTLSEIRQMGFDVDADTLKASYDDDDKWSDRASRYGRHSDEDDIKGDESQTLGTLREEYVLVDYDGDGVSERRRIMRVGDVILSNDECSHVQIAAWTPYVLTHRFDGISVAELVEDFQRIHTDIQRQQLDNLYLANNQELVVQTDSQGNPLANIDDLMNRTPGGVIRERVAGAVRPFAEQWTGIQAMPMLEQLNVEKENRTGYTRYSQGLDGASLNKTATGVSMIMNASQKRMKLMARIAAECMVAPMFRGIFKTLCDYGMESMSFRLRNKFVQYNPQEWRDQYNMTINVGLGAGDKTQQAGHLAQIAQAQAMVAGSPLMGRILTEENIFNLQAKIAENAGFKNPAEFWTDPKTIPPKPPQPNPAMQIEQAKLQADQQKTQATMQMDAQKSAAEMQWEREKFQMELAFKAQQAEREREHQLQLEAVKAQASATIGVM